MTTEEWNERYIRELMRAAKILREEAECCLDATDNPMDGFADDPEGAAQEEMSYWEP